ncbi:STAS domain-containing protein [Imhoffiella purpurea]|uniref:Anti-sigma factor antagonist n=1 Tax=Imhoffiella purpurea TaxID=1249627 RepID=W9V8T2_9GAMM|nr:STAS domain-containing protein [Imhoffiella purpurea]EXJ16013.1 Anti-sigma F factor antagonist (spoIIAA-2) [Imhoffiella purpurea]
MTAEYKLQDDVLVVMPFERLDTISAPGVEKDVMAHIDTGTTKIVFDFQRTNYVSSAGLRVLLKAAKSVDKRGGGVGVCNANSHILEVLDISGFKMVVKIGKTLDKAVAAL